MMSWCPVPGYHPGLRDLIMDISLVRILQVLMILMILTRRVRPMVHEIGDMDENRCDSTVWDAGSVVVGVRDVTTNCAEGHIDWRSPFGAIRVTLQPKRLSKNQKNVPFEACFIASAHYTTVKIYREIIGTDLEPLIVLSPKNGQMLKELCFQSEGDSVILYAEAEVDNQSASLGHVQLDYDVKHLPQPGERQHHDCRPCTEHEILQAVCKSDLVFVGSMDLVTHNADLQETTLHLKVSRIIRQRNDIFKDPYRKRRATRTYPRLKFHTPDGVREFPQREALPSFSHSASSQSDGVLVAPHNCGVRKGHGEFMFIGRIRFKKAFLHCAPRMDDFEKMWMRAKRAERTLCSLE